MTPKEKGQKRKELNKRLQVVSGFNSMDFRCMKTQAMRELLRRFWKAWNGEVDVEKG